MDVSRTASLRSKEFSGGLYGGLHCDVSEGDSYEIYPFDWDKLVKWLNQVTTNIETISGLRITSTILISNDRGLVLDLYIPITE